MIHSKINELLYFSIRNKTKQKPKTTAEWHYCATAKGRGPPTNPPTKKPTSKKQNKNKKNRNRKTKNEKHISSIFHYNKKTDCMRKLKTIILYLSIAIAAGFCGCSSSNMNMNA